MYKPFAQKQQEKRAKRHINIFLLYIEKVAFLFVKQSVEAAERLAYVSFSLKIRSNSEDLKIWSKTGKTFASLASVFCLTGEKY